MSRCAGEKIEDKLKELLNIVENITDGKEESQVKEKFRELLECISAQDDPEVLKDVFHNRKWLDLMVKIQSLDIPLLWLKPFVNKCWQVIEVSKEASPAKQVATGILKLVLVYLYTNMVKYAITDEIGEAGYIFLSYLEHQFPDSELSILQSVWDELKQVIDSLLSLHCPSSSISSALKAVSEKAALIMKARISVEEKKGDAPLTKQFEEKLEQGGKDNIMIPIDRLLGEYIPEKRKIVLYRDQIRRVAEKIARIQKAEPEEMERKLRRIVELHETAHAVIHLGRDADGKEFPPDQYKQIDIKLEETIVQLLCYFCMEEADLANDFEKLCEFLAPEYRLWEKFRNIQPEDLRLYLIRIRRGEITPVYETLEQFVSEKNRS